MIYYQLLYILSLVKNSSFAPLEENQMNNATIKSLQIKSFSLAGKMACESVSLQVHRCQLGGAS